MWKDKLSYIADIRKRRNKSINLGAEEVSILSLKKQFFERFKNKIPDDYLDILRTVNGLEFNGYILYGIDQILLSKNQNQHIYGILEYNEIWYENEWQRKYIFIGESNISWYVYEIKTRKYFLLDMPSGRVVEEFSTASDIVEAILEAALS